MDAATATGYCGACLSQGVALINDLPSGKLPKLLQKILGKLHLQDDKTFTTDEEDALAEAFEVDTAALTLALDTISLLLETIAYHQLDPNAVLKHTQAIGLGEGHSTIFAKAWGALGPKVIKNLRDRSFYDKEATDVSWRLNLRLAQSSSHKVKAPNALFEINVASNGNNGNIAGDKDTKMQMEFTRDELYRFYTQLEIVQAQLDQLS